MLDGEALASRHAEPLLGRSLLGRPPTEAAASLEGRRILVSGAGGSVGRPLVAAIASAAPARLVLLDHHEASLWDLHRGFGARSGIKLVLADVRHAARLREILRQARPEIVFHLAAYKQVPFGEMFADEAFGVNVSGTWNLLHLALEYDVERFVYPSSDKSCQPPSLYGATKRLAEMICRAAASDTGRAINLVRFVNILGTQGSVIETFARQVAAGGPLTVTDSRMTRYWIAMDEAIWLLLSAAALDGGGELLMLDAREEIPVVEIARRVWRLLADNPACCPLEYSAPRPGERLREVLLSKSERFEAGPEPGLLRVVDGLARQHLARLPALLEQLHELAQDQDSQALREAAMAAAGELQ